MFPFIKRTENRSKFNPYEFLKRFTYKTGWRFELNDAVPALCAEVSVPDRDTGAPTTVYHRKYLTPADIRDGKAFMHHIRALIWELEEHEMREWMRYKGQLIDDPHDMSPKFAGFETVRREHAEYKARWLAESYGMSEKKLEERLSHLKKGKADGYDREYREILEDAVRTQQRKITKVYGLLANLEPGCHTVTIPRDPRLTVKRLEGASGSGRRLDGDWAGKIRAHFRD